jgi:hypothetical protein
MKSSAWWRRAFNGTETGLGVPRDEVVPSTQITSSSVLPSTIANATLRASLNGLPLPAITLAADLENPQATVSESAVTILAGRPRCPPLRGI